MMASLIGPALYNIPLYNEALYNEAAPAVREVADPARYQIALGAPPQTFERVFAAAVGRAVEKRVE